VWTFALRFSAMAALVAMLLLLRITADAAQRDLSSPAALGSCGRSMASLMATLTSRPGQWHERPGQFRRQASFDRSSPVDAG
jgi:hypothetical protein